MTAPHPAEIIRAMAPDTLDYTIVDRAGRPFALWSDGTLLPIVRGGADDPPPPPPPPLPPPDDAAKAAADKAAADQKTADDAAAAEAAKAKKIEFTPEQQAEVGRRIAEERTKAAATAKKAAEDEAKTAADRAKMDETDRLKAEKADADKTATDAVAKANTRVITAEAKVQAVEAGADPKQLAYVLRLADLADVKVDDDGEPDAKAIRKIIDKVLTDVPALKIAAGKGGRSGGTFDEHADKGKSRTLEDAVKARLAG